MSEIGVCEECKHPASKYHGIARHRATQLGDYQVYSNQCAEQGCKCDMARMTELPSVAVQKERAKWIKVLQSVIA